MIAPEEAWGAIEELRKQHIRHYDEEFRPLRHTVQTLEHAITMMTELRKIDSQRIDERHEENKVRMNEIEKHQDTTDARVDKIGSKVTFWSGGLAVLVIVIGIVSPLIAAKYGG